MRNLKLRALIFGLVTASMFSTIPVSAAVTVTNDDEYVYVKENKELTLQMPTCAEIVYTAVNLNLRSEPDYDEKSIVKAIPRGTALLRVGKSTKGWSMVQIDKVNYFMRSKYLSIDIPGTAVEAESLTTKKTTKSEKTSTAGKSLGTYYLTAYCNCSRCCGSWAGGQTASGTTPRANHTIATDELPFGTQVMINGTVYTVEDRGSSPYSPWIDIYFDSHAEANAFGLQTAEVYLVD